MEEQKRKDAKELIKHEPARTSSESVDINAFFEEWAGKFSSNKNDVRSLHGI